MLESLLRRGLWGTVSNAFKEYGIFLYILFQDPVPFISTVNKAEPAEFPGKNPHLLGDSGQDISTCAKLSV